MATGTCLGDGWRIVAASVAGPAHLAAAAPRQDAFAIAVAGGCALAVVCDGAGSARCAAAGANRFAGGVLQALRALAEGAMAAERFRDAVIAGVEQVRAALLAEGQALRDHHATLLALVATPEACFIAHVGDGLAGVAAQADWAAALLSPPANGACADETYFVTEDDWQAQLRCTEAPALAAGAAVLLSDGAMPFVIGPGERGLEPDFMAPVQRFLCDAAGDAAAAALAGTLDSREARRISGDDKTLVWIGRAAAER